MNDAFDNAHDDKAILAKLTVAPCPACAAPEGACPTCNGMHLLDACPLEAVVRAAKEMLWQLDANGTAFVNDIIETKETLALRDALARLEESRRG